MKELSIFIDESGDFGNYSHHSPLYLVTLVIHEQSHDISKEVESLVFSSWFHEKFEYRVVSPYEYKLFQVADFICTLALINYKKLMGKDLTVSEKIFFKSYRDLKQNYLKHIKKLEFNQK